MSLTDVAEVLSISASQAYALVRRGDLRAMQVGGRGQWRVERTDLEQYIAQQYAATESYISQHPFRVSEDELTAD